MPDQPKQRCFVPGELHKGYEAIDQLPLAVTEDQWRDAVYSWSMNHLVCAPMFCLLYRREMVSVEWDYCDIFEVRLGYAGQLYYRPKVKTFGPHANQSLAFEKVTRWLIEQAALVLLPKGSGQYDREMREPVRA